MISVNDFSELFNSILHDKHEAAFFLKKILLLNKKKHKGLKKIATLQDLIDIDISLLRNSKEVSDATIHYVISFLEKFKSLSPDELNSIFDELSIFVGEYEDDFLNIELNSLSNEVVPSLIKRKLGNYGIFTIKDVLMNPHTFRDKPKNHAAFTQLIGNLIDLQEELLVKHNENKEDKNILRHFTDFSNKNLIYWFKEIVLNLLDELLIDERDGKRDKKLIEKFYGINNNKKYSAKELSKMYGLSRWWVYKMMNDYARIISAIILGKSLDDVGMSRFKKIKYSIPEHLQQGFCLLYDELRSYYFISNSEIHALLKNNFDSPINEDNKEIFDFFISTIPLEQARINSTTGRLGTNRYSDEIYYLKAGLSQDEKETFYTISNSIYDVLKEEVIPMKCFDVAIEVLERTKMKSKHKDIIYLLLQNIDEFELLDTEGEGVDFEDNFVQLRFDKIISWGDKCYRVLFETGNKMHIDEIVEAIQVKFTHFKTGKYASRSNVRNGILGHNGIKPHGKRSIYSLDIWEETTCKIEDFIINAFNRKNTSMTPKEIYFEIEKIESTLNYRTVSTIASQMRWDKLLPIEGGKYILTEWKNRFEFKDKVIKRERTKSEKSKKLEAYEILKSLNERPILLSDFRRLLIGKYKFSSGTTNHATEDENFIIRDKDNKGRIIVDINPDFNLEKLMLDKVSEKAFLTEKAIEILKNEQDETMFLSEIVNFLHKRYKPDVEKAVVYKIFDQKNYFKKFESVEEKIKVVLIQQQERGFENIADVSGLKGYQYNWNAISDRLCTVELNKTINDVAQPIFGNIELTDLLDLFKAFLTVKTGVAAFDRLADDLLPTLEKYYIGRRDLHEANQYHKAIILTLEAFMLKLLYFVDNMKFLDFDTKIKNGSPVGLGKYIGALNKIDPNNNRGSHNNINSVPKTNFGEHIYRAYQVRNKIAHLGVDYKSNFDWEQGEMHENVRSSLVVCLYALFLYKNDLAPHL